MPRVETSIDWASSYGCSWRVCRVDPATWADLDVVPGSVGASVKRDGGRLFESGTVDFEAGSPPDGEFWGRVEVLADQGGTVERHAVATLLLEPSPSAVRRGWRAASFDGRSVLAPADDVVMPTGSYVPAGADGAAWAARLIGEHTPAPVAAAGSFRLRDAVVFAQGTTRLQAARDLLDAAGWQLQVDGDGAVTIGPRPETPALSVGGATASLLGTEVECDDGLADVPNRYIAVDGDAVAAAVDDDPARRTSHVVRGRYVDELDERPTPVGGETLQAYAERRLAELLAARGRRSYTRAWVPGVTVGDRIDGLMVEASLSGPMRVVSQSLRLGEGIDVDEECELL